MQGTNVIIVSLKNKLEKKQTLLFLAFTDKEI